MRCSAPACSPEVRRVLDTLLEVQQRRRRRRLHDVDTRKRLPLARFEKSCCRWPVKTSLCYRLARFASVKWASILSVCCLSQPAAASLWTLIPHTQHVGKLSINFPTKRGIDGRLVRQCPRTPFGHVRRQSWTRMAFSGRFYSVFTRTAVSRLCASCSALQPWLLLTDSFRQTSGSGDSSRRPGNSDTRWPGVVQRARPKRAVLTQKGLATFSLLIYWVFFLSLNNYLLL